MAFEHVPALNPGRMLFFLFLSLMGLSLRVHGFSTGCVWEMTDMERTFQVSRSGTSKLFASTYKPPDFSILDDDEDDTSNISSIQQPPEFSILDDDDDDVVSITEDIEKSTGQDGGEAHSYVADEDKAQPQTRISSRSRRPIIRNKRGMSRNPVKNMAGTSWLEKNVHFSKQAGLEASLMQQQQKLQQTNDQISVQSSTSTSKPPPRRSLQRDTTRGKLPQRRSALNSSDRSSPNQKSLRQDFRKTRVFVQGIPDGTSWQDLKDHFRLAGEVVFASVSVDPQTGLSKGHGIVQFETAEMARTAIEIMRDHPLFGTNPLFVREDVQEGIGTSNLSGRSGPTKRGPTPPSKWQCANEDNAQHLTDEDRTSIRNLIKARDDARRRRKYDVSDRIRDDLKDDYGVFVDDRLKLWWTSVDGSKVPQSIHDIKGDGKWDYRGAQQPWRQIPTTLENDACVNPDLVDALLTQRDVARREKDFATADNLLREARDCPDGDLTLRIHDESRTWRIWTDEAPPTFPGQERRQRQYDGDEEDEEEKDASKYKNHDPIEMRKQAARKCLDLCKEYAPDKVNEIRTLLKKFPGREFAILKKLKQNYVKQ